MPNLGISPQSIPREMNFLVACGARLPGKLLANGKQFLVWHANNTTWFIDIPTTRQPQWLEFLMRSGLRSTAARQLETGYAQALASISRGEIAPVDGEALSHVLFSGADFSTAVFREIDFSGLQLEGADLHGARFEKCVFKDTELSRSNLSKCVFVDCVFDDTTIHYANAQAATFETCFFHVTRIGGSNLTTARFDRCHFDYFSFEHATLENAKLSDCYMRLVWFGYADARGARFSRLNMVMPDGVTPPDRSTARGGAGFDLFFTETILHDAVFEWCDLEAVYLSTTRGDKLTIADCHIYACSYPWKITDLHGEMRVGAHQTLAQVYGRCNPDMPPPPRPVAARLAQIAAPQPAAPATASSPAAPDIDPSPQANPSDAQWQAYQRGDFGAMAREIVAELRASRRSIAPEGLPRATEMATYDPDDVMNRLRLRARTVKDSHAQPAAANPVSALAQAIRSSPPISLDALATGEAAICDQLAQACEKKDTVAIEAYGKRVASSPELGSMHARRLLQARDWLGRPALANALRTGETAVVAALGKIINATSVLSQTDLFALLIAREGESGRYGLEGQLMFSATVSTYRQILNDSRLTPENKVLIVDSIIRSAGGTGGGTGLTLRDMSQAVRDLRTDMHAQLDDASPKPTYNERSPSRV